MKEGFLLSSSVLIEAMGIVLKRLVKNEEVERCILEEVTIGISYVQNRPSQIAFLKGKEQDECIVLKDVMWLEADGSYTKFHCVDGKTRVLTANLVSTLRQLASNGWDAFLRIHKSYAVNIHHIKSKIGNVLRVGKADLAIGRSYRKVLEKYFITLRKLGK